MNYKIENNLNFYNELYKELNNIIEEKQEDICLLSNSPLEDNYITLDCNHKFNYLPLYNEICSQKKDNFLEIISLNTNQIKCPYCRKITNKLLPYIEHKDVSLKKGVNYPKKYCMILHSCTWNKCNNTLCNKPAIKSKYGIFCNKHQNIIIKKENKIQQCQFINSIWSEEFENINKKYNILNLKKIIREYNLKIENKKILLQGNKKELIYKILRNGIIKSEKNENYLI